jgi:diphthamide biosynthesis protein 7
MEEFDTEYSADSVEFCPIKGFQQNYVIGTYQVENNKEDQNYSRKGRIYLKSTINTELIQSIETSAVLDIKWSQNLIKNSPFLCSSTETEIDIYSLKDKLSLITSVQSNNALNLSCDFEKNTSENNLCVSNSKGNIQLLNLTNTDLIVESEWKAHDYEAWICAFGKNNIIYTGGDDMLFKTYDTRSQTAVNVNKSHEAGVCSIQSHPTIDNLLVTGSYDEFIRVWDTRMMRRETDKLSTGGGVWRLKFHPTDPSLLLAACMYNGFHIFKLTGGDLTKFTGEGFDSIIAGVENTSLEAHTRDLKNIKLEHAQEYKKHESIAYGCDWSYLNDNMIGSCSFYDHLFTLWNYRANK